MYVLLVNICSRIFKVLQNLAVIVNIGGHLEQNRELTYRDVDDILSVKRCTSAHILSTLIFDEKYGVAFVRAFGRTHHYDLERMVQS